MEFVKKSGSSKSQGSKLLLEQFPDAWGKEPQADAVFVDAMCFAHEFNYTGIRQSQFEAGAPGPWVKQSDVGEFFFRRVNGFSHYPTIVLVFDRFEYVPLIKGIAEEKRGPPTQVVFSGVPEDECPPWEDVLDNRQQRANVFRFVQRYIVGRRPQNHIMFLHTGTIPTYWDGLSLVERPELQNMQGEADVAIPQLMCAMEFQSCVWATVDTDSISTALLMLEPTGPSLSGVLPWSNEPVEAQPFETSAPSALSIYFTNNKRWLDVVSLSDQIKALFDRVYNTFKEQQWDARPIKHPIHATVIAFLLCSGADYNNGMYGITHTTGWGALLSYIHMYIGDLWNNDLDPDACFRFAKAAIYHKFNRKEAKRGNPPRPWEMSPESIYFKEIVNHVNTLKTTMWKPIADRVFTMDEARAESLRTRVTMHLWIACRQRIPVIPNILENGFAPRDPAQPLCRENVGMLKKLH